MRSFKFSLLLIASLWLDAGAEDLRSYAKRSQEQVYFGAYVLGRKMGWMSMKSSIGSFQGKEAAVSETREFFQHKNSAFSPASQKTKLMHKYFQLQGEGRLLGLDCVSEQDGARSTVTCFPKGPKWVIRTKVGSTTTERIVNPPKETLAQAQQMEAWLKRAQPGDRKKQFDFTLTQDDPNVEVDYKFVKRRPITWGGVSQTGSEVDLTMRGLKSRLLLRSDNLPLTMTVGPVEIRAEPKQVAQKLDVPVNMMAACSVTIDKPLGDPRRLQRLVLKVEGADKFEFPTSERQKVERQAGLTSLTLVPERPGLERSQLSPEQRRTYLSATQSVQLTPAVKKLAASIVSPGESTRVKSSKLSHWVATHLKKTYSRNAENTTEVINNLAGDCTEHSLLFVSLARASGIPCRQVGGLAYARSLLGGSFAWHAWAQVYDHGWISVDPTWDEDLVDASHIQMSEDSDDLKWTSVLGKMKFQALEVKN